MLHVDWNVKPMSKCYTFGYKYYNSLIVTREMHSIVGLASLSKQQLFINVAPHPKRPAIIIG